MLFRRRLPSRARAVDLLLVCAAIALIATPLVVPATAAGPVVEVPVSVGQEVRSTAVISLPIEGDFDVASSGKSVGSVKWDVYTTAKQGYKLVLHSKAKPAMWDNSSLGARVDDYGTSPSAWSVGSGERRFGFSATGSRVLSAFEDDGDKRWRGFDGTRPIEVARYRGGSLPTSRTTVWLAAEMRNPLPSGAKMDGLLVATAMANL